MKLTIYSIASYVKPKSPCSARVVFKKISSEFRRRITEKWPLLNRRNIQLFAIQPGANTSSSTRVSCFVKNSAVLLPCQLFRWSGTAKALGDLGRSAAAVGDQLQGKPSVQTQLGENHTHKVTFFALQTQTSYSDSTALDRYLNLRCNQLPDNLKELISGLDFEFEFNTWSEFLTLRTKSSKSAMTTKIVIDSFGEPIQNSDFSSLILEFSRDLVESLQSSSPKIPKSHRTVSKIVRLMWDTATDKEPVNFRDPMAAFRFVQSASGLQAFLEILLKPLVTASLNNACDPDPTDSGQLVTNCQTQVDLDSLDSLKVFWQSASYVSQLCHNRKSKLLHSAQGYLNLPLNQCFSTERNIQKVIFANYMAHIMRACQDKAFGDELLIQLQIALEALELNHSSHQVHNMGHDFGALVLSCNWLISHLRFLVHNNAHSQIESGAGECLFNGLSDLLMDTPTGVYSTETATATTIGRPELHALFEDPDFICFQIHRFTVFLCWPAREHTPEQRAFLLDEHGGLAAYKVPDDPSKPLSMLPSMWQLPAVQIYQSRDSTVSFLACSLATPPYLMAVSMAELLQDPNHPPVFFHLDLSGIPYMTEFSRTTDFRFCGFTSGCVLTSGRQLVRKYPRCSVIANQNVIYNSHLWLTMVKFHHQSGFGSVVPLQFRGIIPREILPDELGSSYPLPYFKAVEDFRFISFFYFPMLSEDQLIRQRQVHVCLLQLNVEKGTLEFRVSETFDLVKLNPELYIQITDVRVLVRPTHTNLMVQVVEGLSSELEQKADPKFLVFAYHRMRLSRVFVDRRLWNKSVPRGFRPMLPVRCSSKAIADYFWRADNDQFTIIKRVLKE